MILNPNIWAAAIFSLALLSGCSAEKTTLNSGALNTMSIELGDENVNYLRLESDVKFKSFAGFLSGSNTNRNIEATIVTNNNGENNSSSIGRSGANLATLLTLLANSGLIYNGLDAAFPNNSEIRVGARIELALIAIGLGLAVNEAEWRPLNRQRVTSEAVRNAMILDSDADFYSFPHAELLVEPRFMGTGWTGSYRIVSGTVSDDLFKPFKDAPRVGAIQDNTDDSSMDENSRKNQLTENQDIEIKPGVSGVYANRKGETRKFVVLEILDYSPGNSEFILRIQFENGEEQTVKSTNPKIKFESAP